MSLLSVGEIITLVYAIQSQVKNYENNNAIVKDYARICSSVGSFLEANQISLENLDQDDIRKQLNDLGNIVKEIDQEITKYKGKAFFKHVVKATKYKDRFTNLSIELHNSQQILQTMLLGYIAGKVHDIHEAQSIVQCQIEETDEDAIRENCDSILVKFHHDFHYEITNGVERVQDLMEKVTSNTNELKDFLLDNLEAHKEHQRELQNQQSSSEKEELHKFMSDFETLFNQKTIQLIEKVTEIVEDREKHDNHHPSAFTRYGLELQEAIKIESNELPANSLEFINWNKMLGRGSFGKVFEGKLRNHDEKVAVKVLEGSDDADKKQFLRECSVLSRVNGCQYIIHYYGCLKVELQGGGSSMAMITEYCPMSLKKKIDSSKSSDSSLIVLWIEYAKQIAKGMHFLVTNGVIHRDLKAENCLITKEGNVVICDFGLSTTKESFQSRSKDNSKGSVGYLAPEIYQGKPPSEESDVYSYGILVAYMLSGIFPWEKLHDEAIKRLVVDEKKTTPYLAPEYLNKKNFPVLSSRLLHLFIRCCSYEIFHRPRFLELKNALENPFEEISASSSVKSSPFVSPLPSPLTSPSHTKRLEDLDSNEVSYMVLALFKSWQCHLDNEHRALYENFSEVFKKRNIVGEDLAEGSEASILSLLHLNPKDITTIEVRIKRFFKEVDKFKRDGVPLTLLPKFDFSNETISGFDILNKEAETDKLCPYCEHYFSQSEFYNHANSCLKCVHCTLRFPVNEIASHTSSCGFRCEPCKDCNKLVRVIRMEEHYSICEKNDIISDNDIVIDELADIVINKLVSTNSSTESLTVTESNETTRESLNFKCPYCTLPFDDDNHIDLCEYKVQPCKDCGAQICINNPKKVSRHMEICTSQEE